MIIIEIQNKGQLKNKKVAHGRNRNLDPESLMGFLESPTKTAFRDLRTEFGL